MDGIRQRLKELLGPYKYALAVLVLGLGLMLLPSKSESQQPEPQTLTESTPDTAGQLEQILSQIQGVGRVKVLLTVARGEQILYLTDEDEEESAGTVSRQREAVIVTDAQRAQNGLICQVLPPVYQGAVIVCQGGDQSAVRLAVVEAVCDATGLTADKITVLKMK